MCVGQPFTEKNRSTFFIVLCYVAERIICYRSMFQMEKYARDRHGILLEVIAKHSPRRDWARSRAVIPSAIAVAMFAKEVHAWTHVVSPDKITTRK